MFKRSRQLSVGFILVCLMTLAGCSDIFVNEAKPYIFSPSYVSDYYLRYDINFELGQYSVHAIRYGEVAWMQTLLEPPHCHKDVPSCWRVFGEFLISLPNGDIVQVRAEDQDIIPMLSHIVPGKTYNTTFRIIGIFHNQISNVKIATGALACLRLDDAETLRVYDLPIHSAELGKLSNLNIFRAQIRREESPPEHTLVTSHTLDKDHWILKAAENAKPCEYYFQDAAQNVTIHIHNY